MSVGQFGKGEFIHTQALWVLVIVLSYMSIHLLTNWLNWQTDRHSDSWTVAFIISLSQIDYFWRCRWPHNSNCCCCNNNSSNCNMPHISQQDKFLYNCICCRLQSRPAKTKKIKIKTMLHYFYINCMPLTVHSTLQCCLQLATVRLGFDWVGPGLGCVSILLSPASSLSSSSTLIVI